MDKKYVVHPGTVQSISDRDIHYISADNLIRLYGVNPAECIIATENGDNWERGYTKEVIIRLIHLYPRQDGNYELK